MVLFEEAYWRPLLDWIRDRLLADGMISREDLALLTVTDDPQEVVRMVLAVVSPQTAKP